MSRIPPACEASPAPAVLAWSEGGSLRWEVNEAARRWAPTQHWTAGEWASLARLVLDQAAQGRREGDCVMLQMRWRAAASDGAWLAWLLPQHEAADPELEGLREQIARLHEYLHLAVEIGRMGLSERDIRLQRGRWDEQMFRFFGMDPGLGIPTFDEAMRRVHPEDRDRVRSEYVASMQRPGRYDSRWRLAHPDGRLTLMHSVWQVTAGADGKPERLIGLTLDDTESVHLAREAQASQRQLALAVGLVGIGLWRRDLDTRGMQFNARANELLGRATGAAEMTDLQLWEAMHPDDRDAVRRADQRALAGNDIVDAEVRCAGADGRYRTLMTRRVAERDAHGRAIALVGVALDLTEQRETQERLRLAEQRTVLAAKAVGLANWERDIATGDLWWDAQMYRLRGLAPDDPRPPQRLHHECTHPDDVDMVHRRIAQVVDGDKDFFFEFRIVRPDGAVRWLATRGSVSRDGAGRALRVFGFNWDVTEHKRGEDVRREKAAAEEASRAKSEFLSRMSHELRTPLNAVLGFSQLLLEDPVQTVAGPQRERMQHIRDAGRHLLALIDDVLDLTSVEVGTVPLAAQPVALAPLVAETLQWVAPAAQRAQVTLAPGPVAATVQGDARRLRQVLANLLSNAVKYNRPGGRVEVELLPCDPSRVGLRVRDTGRGLTQAQVQRLFEPFNRLGAEREGIEGTGIGLTIVRALVEAMSGRVEVDSTPGAGTEFRVWLPAAREEAPLAAPVAVAPEASSEARALPIDLLYIEDNAINVLLVQELVALRPHVRLHVAYDGRSGIARSRELRPQGVLIDLQLPDIDGFEVLRALRGDPSLNGVVCIALSANAMPDDVARAKKSGFDDYWTKPIDFSQFLEGIDALARGEALPVR